MRQHKRAWIFITSFAVKFFEIGISSGSFTELVDTQKCNVYRVGRGEEMRVSIAQSSV